MPIFKRRRQDAPLGEPVPAETETVAKPTSDALVEAAEAVVTAYEADPVTLGGDSTHAHQHAELPSPARRAARRRLAGAIEALRDVLADPKET